MKMSMNNDDKLRPLYDGTHEDDQRSFDQRIKEERDERERRERMRAQRLAASGKTPLPYSLDVIIEKCVMNENSERIEIDFYALGFPDHIQEVNSVERLFHQLKGAGCFEAVKRSANTYFVVSRPNIEKLNQYRASIERTIGKPPKKLIHKDSDGDFFYNGQRIEMEKHTLHYDLLDILYSSAREAVSYEALDAALVARGHDEKTNSDASKKRIRNILTNQLFKLAKVNGEPLQNHALDNKPLIEVVRGEGLRLNNPII
ncbi:hypothetical protein C4568_00250 [Candidatus Parcubacteria bacterium]|nr:MAG: hypothetical protein C4568_00250 [Candidatus Parcubacteria bacterium]